MPLIRISQNAHDALKELKANSRQFKYRWHPWSELVSDLILDAAAEDKKDRSAPKLMTIFIL